MRDGLSSKESKMNKLRWLVPILFILISVLPILSQKVEATDNIPLCIVDYHYHNDSTTNADQTAIIAANPQILIDNGPNGLYIGDTIPSHYTSQGIEFYDYITSGYEHTKYLNTMDLLSDNIARVDAIGTESSTGVFMDEVSAYPTSGQESYLTSIWNECQSLGLKLIINTGVGDFNATFLKTVSNYIMVNEAYTGSNPTSSEISYGTSRCLVANDSCSSFGNAISYTETAWTKGFGWAWCTDNTSYNLPSYMSSYISGLSYTETTTTTTTATTSTTTTTTSSSPTAPSISVSVVTNKTATSVTLNGNVTSTGGDNPWVTLYWDTSNEGEGTWANNSVPTSPSQPQSAIAFYCNLTGLTPNTFYYYTAKAVNSEGTSWSTAGTFTTLNNITTTTSITTGTTTGTSTTTTPIGGGTTPTPPTDSSMGFIFLLPLVMGVGCFVGAITFMVQKHFQMMFMAILFGVICFVIVAATLGGIGNLI